MNAKTTNKLSTTHTGNGTSSDRIKAFQNDPSSFDKMLAAVFSPNDLMGYDFFHNSSPFWAKDSKYPPYDVVELDENSYRIDIAVAGFDRENIDVTVTDDVLQVSAENSETEKVNRSDYIHKGIGKRSFRNKFRLPQYAEVDKCELTNGILSITIEKRVPEEKLPKKVKIR